MLEKRSITHSAHGGLVFLYRLFSHFEIIGKVNVK